MNAKKPVEGANHPDDVKAVENAKHTIGDFKLQSSDGFTVPEHLQESTLKKYQQLLESRVKVNAFAQYIISEDISNKICIYSHLICCSMLSTQKYIDYGTRR